MRLLPRLTVLGLATAATVAMAAPTGVTAAGTTPHKFSWKLGTKSTPGKGAANGSIRFLDNGRRVTIRANADDRCPGDGYAIRLLFDITYVDGSKNGRGIIDERGCTASPALSLNWTSLKGTAKIKEVRVDFYEHDGKTMQIGDFRPPVFYRP